MRYFIAIAFSFCLSAEASAQVVGTPEGLAWCKDHADDPFCTGAARYGCPITGAADDCICKAVLGPENRDFYSGLAGNAKEIFNACNKANAYTFPRPSEGAQDLNALQRLGGDLARQREALRRDESQLQGGLDVHRKAMAEVARTAGVGPAQPKPSPPPSRPRAELRLMPTFVGVNNLGLGPAAVAEVAIALSLPYPDLLLRGTLGQLTSGDEFALASCAELGFAKPVNQARTAEVGALAGWCGLSRSPRRADFLHGSAMARMRPVSWLTLEADVLFGVVRDEEVVQEKERQRSEFGIGGMLGLGVVF